MLSHCVFLILGTIVVQPSIIEMKPKCKLLQDQTL